MTTGFKILNDGPGLLKIEIQQRNAQGQFVAADEKFLRPGNFYSGYCYSGQSVQVIEVHGDAEKAASPAVPPKTED